MLNAWKKVSNKPMVDAVPNAPATGHIVFFSADTYNEVVFLLVFDASGKEA
jgi:hypothetical protein